jgi:hypothetical protein
MTQKQREPYAAPSIEPVTMSELMSEAERLMRRSKLELEDLEIVRESIDTRIAAMQTAAEKLAMLLKAARNCHLKMESLFELQKKGKPWWPPGGFTGTPPGGKGMSNSINPFFVGHDDR